MYQEKRDVASRNSIAMGANGVNEVASLESPSSLGLGVMELCNDLGKKLREHHSSLLVSRGDGRNL
jgi:hypothetical protein